MYREIHVILLWASKQLLKFLLEKEWLLIVIEDIGVMLGQVDQLLLLPFLFNLLLRMLIPESCNMCCKKSSRVFQFFFIKTNQPSLNFFPYLDINWAPYYYWTILRSIYPFFRIMMIMITVSLIALVQIDANTCKSIILG